MDRIFWLLCCVGAVLCPGSVSYASLCVFVFQLNPLCASHRSERLSVVLPHLA
jgi:hypothetical protein